MGKMYFMDVICCLLMEKGNDKGKEEIKKVPVSALFYFKNRINIYEDIVKIKQKEFNPYWCYENPHETK